MAIDGVVLVRVKEGPKVQIRELFAASIHMSFTSFIDYALLGLLGILDSHLVGELNGCMPLEGHMDPRPHH
jgi:hypothetical protein